MWPTCLAGGPQMNNITLDPLSPKEAIDYFKDKIVLTPAQFYQLSRQAMVNAFTAAEVTSLDILNDIFEELAKAIEDGTTMNEFRKSINERMEARGWTGFTPYRADTIFRQNVQTAYQVGRWKQMTTPAVLADRPYGVYSAVMDSHTRATHRAMHGVCRRLDDPFWDTWYPPNGFRCRCSVRTLSQRQVDKQKIKVATGDWQGLVEAPGEAARQLVPDPGFDYNSGKEAYQPDLSKYTKRLREAYEKRQQEKAKA